MSYALQQAQHFPRRESATKKKEFIGSGKDCTNTNRSSSNHAYDLRPAQKAEAQRAYISSPLQATNDGLKKKNPSKSIGRPEAFSTDLLLEPISQYFQQFDLIFLKFNEEKASRDSIRYIPERTSCLYL
ncbi:MAG TPA: hypothetical protein H9768_04865 [Candidatus Mailhella merdavium]|nr:hypothetical protein [Candidatus Mailhella merdavium]